MSDDSLMVFLCSCNVSYCNPWRSLVNAGFPVAVIWCPMAMFGCPMAPGFFSSSGGCHTKCYVAWHSMVFCAV